MEEIKKKIIEIWENENMSEEWKAVLTYIIVYKIFDTTKKTIKEIINEELSE